MSKGDQKSLARSLGQFFGHLIHGVKSPAPPTRQQVRREVEEERVQTPQGQVVLRRTIIEEVEIKNPQGG